MKRFGLVGYPLGHSYSKGFFQKKFKELGLDYSYELFEMEYLNAFSALWLQYDDLIGVNVTVPYKEKVLKYLDKQDNSVIKVGAANVVMRQSGKLIGFNTDYMAFKQSLSNWIGSFDGEALILGSGGASKAVQAALSDLKIPFNQVSRKTTSGDYTYQQLHTNPEIIQRFHLIINTTPVGMYPDNESSPDIPYDQLGENHYLYDLVYNPEKTTFLNNGLKKGSQIKNGMEMLEMQAERSWEIWNNN